MWTLLAVVFVGGAVCGMAVAAALLFYAYTRYLNVCTLKTIKSHPFLFPHLGEHLNAFLESNPRPSYHQNDTLPKEQLQSLNLVLAELFFQLRDTVPVKRFFFNMLDRNFMVLRNKTSLGNICKRFTVSDINFGATMPELCWATPVRPRNATLGMADHLEVEVELAYEGKFNIQVDADLIFGKKAKVSITVVALNGIGRFGLKQLPESHWFFSFNDDPDLQLEVEATFEGRLIPQLSNIIKTQIKNAIHRTQVHPAQKKRYAPFFPMPQELSDPILELYGVNLFAGELDVEVVCCRDLQGVRAGTGMFVHMSLVDEELEDAAHHTSESHDEQEVEVLKAGAGGTIGIYFKEREANGCLIEAIKSGSPASAVTALQPGCIIKAVNGISVMTNSQAHKLIKESGSKVMLRVGNKETDRAPGSRGGAGERKVLTAERTPVVAANKSPMWHYHGRFTLNPSHTRLYVRVYDCKLKRGELVGKRFLVGFTEVNLETAALHCAANQAPMLKRYRLRKAAQDGAPEVGCIELLLNHKPRPFLHYQAPGTTQTVREREEVRGDAHDERDDMEGDEAEEEDDEFGDSQDRSLGRNAQRVHGAAVGTDLFADLPLAERRRELDQLLETVKTQLELETETHADLERQLRAADKPADIRRLRSNIQASEERKDELNIRAFKCVAAMTACDDLDDLERV